MPLKALDIYKLLPKKNCKECGDPTCLTFAMKLAAGKADVDLCPYLDENAKSVLGATTRPPIKLVKLGVGERSFTVGEEFVLYRHDKTFYHPPGIMFSVSDMQSEEEIMAITARVRDETLTRVGADLKFNGTAIVNTSGTVEAFARAVAAVEKTAGLPEVLVSENPAALAAALVKCGSYRPLICAATTTNYREYVHSCKTAWVPARRTGPHARRACTAHQRLRRRRGAKHCHRSCPANAGRFYLPVNGNPAACYHPGGPGTRVPGIPERNVIRGRRRGNCSRIVRYASVIVTTPLSPASAKAALTLRQNIYTDPQKPIQMNPGLYRVGTPGKDAPVLMTVNFSLTYFTLQGYLESSRIPCFMLIVDTEGLSVLTSVAAGKLNETLVRDAIKKFGVENEVTHRKLIIPGYSAPFQGG